MIVTAKDKFIKSSVQKLNLVADLIRNEDVNDAMMQLRFCKRSVAHSLVTLLKSAIANSQNNFGLDIDKLYIKEVRVGKSLTLKRSRVRGRGKIDRVLKPFSKATIVLKERG